MRRSTDTAEELSSLELTSTRKTRTANGEGYHPVQIEEEEQDGGIIRRCVSSPSARRLALALACFVVSAVAASYIWIIPKACRTDQDSQHDPSVYYPTSWCPHRHMAPPRLDEPSGTDEANPPNWPTSVKIFNSSQSAEEIKASIQETEDPTITQVPEGMQEPIQTYTAQHHFSNQRWALFFEPGEYSGLDFEVGYYVQVLGLGAAANMVKFVDCLRGPFIPSLEQTTVHVPWGLGLDTFWRSAENFYTEAAQGQQWVVSQASPLRRVHVAKKRQENPEQSGSLSLSYGDAWVSGGVLANAIIEGPTDFGGQQQWLSRNVEFQGTVSGGAWSLVFVGCTDNVPEPFSGSVDRRLSVSVDATPRIRVEKPFIAIEDGKYKLRIPQVTMGTDAVGADLMGGNDIVRDFTRVKVARDDLDDVLSLQKALDEGKDLVLSPGIYHLATSLKVRYANQVVLGIGLATLVAPTDGSPCIRILPRTHGVRVAGIMLEASKQELEMHFTDTRDACDGISSLLEWGYHGEEDSGDPSQPGVMTDVFARVGGSSLDRAVSTDVMVRIHSGNVVGDNLWLWRADHVELRPGEEPNYPTDPNRKDSSLPPVSDSYHQTTKDECKCSNGLIVNGNDVTIHGLAVEHVEEHQVIWNGDRGQVRFYQSELPYDVTHAVFGKKNYTGYYVSDIVSSHDAMGVGVYSNFRDYTVEVSTAIRHPKKNGINFVNPFTVLLDNHGSIQSVVNGYGNKTTEKGVPTRVDEGLSSSVCRIFP